MPHISSPRTQLQKPESGRSEHMITVDADILGDQLGRCLDSVRAGEEVAITENGSIIARIVPQSSGKREYEDDLAVMMAKGLVDLPARRPGHNRNRTVIPREGTPISGPLRGE